MATTVKSGTIKIEHISSASLVKITLKRKEEKNAFGEIETVEYSTLLEYSEYKDLKQAIKEMEKALDWL